MLEQALRRAEKKIETMIEHSKVDDVFKRFEAATRIEGAYASSDGLALATTRGVGFW